MFTFLSNECNKYLYCLGIERVLKISYFDDTKNTFTTIEEKHIYQTAKSWISFNISTTIQQLLSNKTTTKIAAKFILTIKSFVPFLGDQTTAFKVSLMPLVDDYEHDYPVLLLFYKSERKERSTGGGRKKRSVDEDYEEETNRIWDEGSKRVLTKKMKRLRNSCKRRPLYVDFAEIQYDSWIVQPTGYEVI